MTEVHCQPVLVQLVWKILALLVVLLFLNAPTPPIGIQTICLPSTNMKTFKSHDFKHNFFFFADSSVTKIKK